MPVILSEAREKGGKVPRQRKSSRKRGRKAAKKRRSNYLLVAGAGHRLSIGFAGSAFEWPWARHPARSCGWCSVTAAA
jgi:hypothetical protein